MLETDRPGVLRQAIQAVRKGGTLSIPGVYGGLLDKVPFGAAFGKGITMKMGQTHMHKYMKPLLERIEKGQIDPTLHHLPPHHARPGAGDVQDVARQEGTCHQDRDRSVGGNGRGSKLIANQQKPSATAGGVFAFQAKLTMRARRVTPPRCDGLPGAAQRAGSITNGRIGMPERRDIAHRLFERAARHPAGLVGEARVIGDIERSDRPAAPARS